MVGIRAQESLNRYHAVTQSGDYASYRGISYSTEVFPDVYNFYPLYDWMVDDVWTANNRFGFDNNKLYDLFYMAGVPLKKMRVANPFHIEASTHSSFTGRLSPTHGDGLMAA